MAVEIERKFLVQSLGGLELPPGDEIDQGYLSDGDPTVRVRLRAGRGYLTIKYAPGQSEKKSGAIINQEYEYEIPAADALEILAFSHARLTKTRHTLSNGIEVDIFSGRHSGLILAEYESEDGSYPASNEGIDWIEVTNDFRYTNSWIARNGIPPRE